VRQDLGCGGGGGHSKETVVESGVQRCTTMYLINISCGCRVQMNLAISLTEGKGHILVHRGIACHATTP